jgi:hypothetical protein
MKLVRGDPVVFVRASRRMFRAKMIFSPSGEKESARSWTPGLGLVGQLARGRVGRPQLGLVAAESLAVAELYGPVANGAIVQGPVFVWLPVVSSVSEIGRWWRVWAGCRVDGGTRSGRCDRVAAG